MYINHLTKERWCIIKNIKLGVIYGQFRIARKD